MRSNGSGSPRSGLSLVEILFTGAIVVLGVLPVITVMTSSGSSVRQTSPYMQALFLSTMALEEARLGSAEDPHSVDRLVDEGYGSLRGPAIRGGHPYLERIEDRSSPWGRIDPDEDGSVVPELGSLYELVEPLALRLAARRDPGGGGARVEIRFDWLDGRGRSMAYEQVTPLRVWTPLSRVEGLQEDAGPAATGSKQAAIDRILALGTMGESALAARSARIANEAQTVPTGDGPGKDGRVEIRRARLHEGLASELLGLLQGMRPAVEELAGGLPPGSLPGTPSDARKRRIVDVIRIVLDGFFEHTRAAIVGSLAAAGEPGLTLSERVQAHRMAWRVMALESLAMPWPDRDPLKLYLARLEDFYRHRLPHVVHHFEVERRELPTLETTYHLAPAAADVLGLRQSYSRAAINVLLY